MDKGLDVGLVYLEITRKEEVKSFVLAKESDQLVVVSGTVFAWRIVGSSRCLFPSRSIGCIRVLLYSQRAPATRVSLHQLSTRGLV